MGMFDTFRFKDGFLPNNKVEEDYDFQTKDLESDLDMYCVDSIGNVSKHKLIEENEYDDEAEDVSINDIAYVYSHEFLHDNKGKYTGSKQQCYKIVIVSSQIVYVEKLSEEGYEED